MKLKKDFIAHDVASMGTRLRFFKPEKGHKWDHSFFVNVAKAPCGCELSEMTLSDADARRLAKFILSRLRKKVKAKNVL